MQRNKTNGNMDAFSLFPELMDTFLSGKHKPDKISPAPPEPPDISWLRTGRHEEHNQAKDVPSALVLMNDGKNANVVATILQKLSYQVELVDTPLKAIEKIRSNNFSVILLHSEFEGGVLSGSMFHDYMKWLPMEQRRHIFYMLIGPEFRTFYNLEAYSFSANLVVNDRDMKHLSLILRKSFQDYEDLFGPFFETLSAYGKQ